MDGSTLIQAYIDRFGVSVPWSVMELNEAELVGLLQKALDTGQPLPFPNEPDQVY